MRAWIWGAVAVVAGLIATVAAGSALQQLDWLHVILFAFTIYGIAILLVPLLGVQRSMYSVEPRYRPFVSIMIPARNEEAVIEATVRSLCTLEYHVDGKPHYEILVLDDGSTDQTAAVMRKLRDDLPQVRVHTRTDRRVSGKSAVLNEGLPLTRGEVIAVFDADTRVEPDFLARCVPYLADPRVGGVQTRVRIYNAGHNLLTAMQEDEFAVFAHLTQLAKDSINGLTALGGNGQLTRRSALEAVTGWNEMSTTEDLDLTLQLLLRGVAVRYCGEAVIWQEAVTSWRSLLRQRSRWAEGFIKCCYDYLPAFAWHPMGPFQRWDGLLSLVRVLLPLWMWAMYASIGTCMLLGGTPASHLPHAMFASVSCGFFAVTFACIRSVLRVSLLQAAVCTARYWLYNFVWMLAVPIGFVNGIRYIDTIRWDKTVHSGPSSKLAPPRLASPGERRTWGQEPPSEGREVLADSTP